MSKTIDERNLQRILSIGVALTAERDMNRLLNTILTEAIAITDCDAGTLYLLEDDKLHFKIMHNHSLGIFLGGEGVPVGLPPLELSEANVASYVTIHRNMENIADVYVSDKFDFTGPKQYDNLTGYRTQSMLVVPLLNNRDEIIGTLQLMNAMDRDKNVIPFAKEYEEIFRSVSSLAAIAVTNMRFTEENRALFQSLVEVLAAAIDERSPYNAYHTYNVVELTKGYVDFINKKHNEGRTNIYFSPESAEQIVMAAWLHDIGKIITPLDIMDKSTRLGDKLPLVLLRLEAIAATERANYLEGKTGEADYARLAAEISEASALCQSANAGAPAGDEELALIRSYGERRCIMADGRVQPWLTPDEIECLGIRYGTLTPAERRTMEEHVEITGRLLEKIRFSRQYRNVSTYAVNHHEKLNGHGYPGHKTGSELPLGARIITIMDIFEALTAKDRPYKSPIPFERSFAILSEMAESGEIDAELVQWLIEWKSTVSPVNPGSPGSSGSPGSPGA